MLANILRKALGVALILIVLYETITGGGLAYINQCHYLCPQMDIHHGMITMQPVFHTSRTVKYIPLVVYTDISRPEVMLSMQFNLAKECENTEKFHITINSVKLGDQIIDDLSKHDFTIGNGDDYVRIISNTESVVPNKPFSLKIEGTYRVLSNNETHVFQQESIIQVEKAVRYNICWNRLIYILNH